jgi:uncharacterized protein (DUF58 family)
MKAAASIVLAGLFLILAAFTFDSSVLFVPGVSLTLLGALVPAWIWLATRGASAVRTLDADSVVEDQPLEARIQVRCGRLGLPGAEVIDPLAAGAVAIGGMLPTAAEGRLADMRLIARFPRRGRHRFEAPALVISDPLGLVRIGREGSPPVQELLVLPRTERLRWIERAADARPVGALGRTPEALAAAEVDGLRPYRVGTPASRIHWPALARGQGLLERRMRAERDSGPLVVIDARTSGPLTHVDAAVRAAASITLEVARRGGCELLMAPDRRPIHVAPDLGAWPGAHARLALLEGGPDAPAPILGSRPRVGPVYYVAAQRIERVPAALARNVHRAVVLVVPAELAEGIGHSASFEVAGCLGFVFAGAASARPYRRAA